MWEDLELDPERIPTFKLVFHSLQIVFGFVSWCLEIAVFRADKAKIVGNNGWTFAVFFLTIPAWIYLLMAPRFPRTRKLAQPHAMVAIDSLFTVIWISAFATQAAYNTANLCGTACGVSKGIVALGFFVFLFFCVTTFLSIWTLKYYQWNNRLPGYDRAQLGSQNIDPDKAAFSLAPHDEEAYAPVNMSDHDDPHHDGPTAYGGAASTMGSRSDYSDPYGPSASVAGGGGGGSTVSGYQDNPFRQQQGANPFDDDNTEYNSGRVSAAGHTYGAPPSTATYGAAPSTADGFDNGASFPHANYDRIER